MNCKKCKAQLEDGVTICPACGTDNTPEQPKGIVLTPGKLALVIGFVVVLTALVVGLIMNGMGYSFNKPLETEPEESLDSAETTEYVEAEPTIPADGNAEDVTCKGSYSASDEDVIAAGDTVVATIDDAELTVSELQIYYWMQVRNFLTNYGSYASYFGLDITQSLDTQVCGVSESGLTWQQYFLQAALADWHNYQSLAQEAKANGFTMDEETLAEIDALPESLETEGQLLGYEGAEDYLKSNVGNGAEIEDYQDYMYTYYEGFLYFQSKYDAMVPTEEELVAYFNENAEEYASQGVTMEDIYVDVRHILVLPEGATVETIYTDTFSEEAWAAGEKNAEDILNQWLSGDKTEDSFAALANEKSQDPGSNTAGGLYTDVYVGQMVEEFENWCFDESRQVGDYGIVKTSLGYHIMYFSGSRPVWRDYAESDLLSERGMELIYATTDAHPMTVDYSKALIADAHPENW